MRPAVLRMLLADPSVRTPHARRGGRHAHPFSTIAAFLLLSGDFQTEITFLGMTSSPAFVRQPEGNGCIERLRRTLKEQLLWVRFFSTIEDLCQALLAFKETYNREWLIARLGYRSPAPVRPTFAVRPAA